MKLRSPGDPVCFCLIQRASIADSAVRCSTVLRELNQEQLAESGDPEISTRIAQYEMAFRMQTSVPDLIDLTQESDGDFQLYGDDAKKPGTFAANCLFTRRLFEQGVRFVQLYHRGWDQHGGLPTNMPKQCIDIDQAQAALITDLKQRGMLEDTLMIWGGEFGRTVYGQGGLQETTAAIITAAVFPCGSPVAGSVRGDVRPDGRLRLQHRPRSGPHS